MAKIRLGPNITEISGPINNLSYGRWLRSEYLVKGRAGINKNPVSQRQAEIRRYTKEASDSWVGELTQPQRDSWGTYARDMPPKDGNPDPIHNLIHQSRNIMSGYHAYVGASVMTRSIGMLPGPTIRNSPLGQTGPSAPQNLTAAYVPQITPNYMLNFDGVNESVRVGDVLGYDWNQPQSWEFFGNPTGLVAAQAFLSKQGPPNTRGYHFQINGNNIDFRMFNNVPVENIRVRRALVGPGVRKHFVITYDGSGNANGMRIYIDSVVGQAIIANIPLTGPITTTNLLYFASLSGGAGSLLAGQMQTIRNYNRVITQPEVNTVFNGGAGLYSIDPFADGSCQGAWMFCAGSGNTLVDLSGNNYNGTLLNMDPGDWQAGLVACPVVLAHVDVAWEDPAVFSAGTRIRVWCKTQELMVHKQIPMYQDVGPQNTPVTYVRGCNGHWSEIGQRPGHYIFQVDAVQPNGQKSPPSRIAVVTVP